MKLLERKIPHNFSAAQWAFRRDERIAQAISGPLRLAGDCALLQLAVGDFAKIFDGTGDPDPDLIIRIGVTSVLSFLGHEVFREGEDAHYIMRTKGGNQPHRLVDRFMDTIAGPKKH